MSELILEVKDLVVDFRTDRGKITAVNGVNLDVYKGKTLGCFDRHQSCGSLGRKGH